MSSQHRATPEQWQAIGVNRHLATRSCLLELLHRVEALEDALRTMADVQKSTEQAELEYVELALRRAAEAVIHRASQATSAEAQPNCPAKPDSSLVERVAFAIVGDSAVAINWKLEARAAIRVVAAWVRAKPFFGGHSSVFAMLLEREAER